jgi:hypothetical protein
MPVDKSLLPFNAFDLFAYISNGLLVLIVTGALASTHLANAEPFSPAIKNGVLGETLPSIALALIVAYIIGHLLAQVSALLCDRLLVRRYFGDPGAHAIARLRTNPVGVKGSRATLLVLGVPEYARPLSHLAARRLELAAQRALGHSIDSEHYSIRSCFAIVNEDAPQARGRLEIFLGLYSFCRNCSVALLLLSLAAVAVGGLGELRLALGFFIAAVLIFGRYLKFLKLYTDEILISFSSYVNSQDSDNGSEPYDPRTPVQRKE